MWRQDLLGFSVSLLTDCVPPRDSLVIAELRSLASPQRVNP